MYPAIAVACGTVSFTGCKVAAVVVIYAERLPGDCAGAFAPIALKDFFPDTGLAADLDTVLHQSSPKSLTSKLSKSSSMSSSRYIGFGAGRGYKTLFLGFGLGLALGAGFGLAASKTSVVLKV